MNTTKLDPHAEQEQRAAQWHGWRPSRAPACPRVAAGKRCQTGTSDRLCVCQRHHHLLDHARMWLDPEGAHVLTAEPYDTHLTELVLQRQIFTRPAAISREVNSGCNRDQWNSTTPKLI